MSLFLMFQPDSNVLFSKFIKTKDQQQVRWFVTKEANLMIVWRSHQDHPEHGPDFEWQHHVKAIFPVHYKSDAIEACVVEALKEEGLKI